MEVRLEHETQMLAADEPTVAPRAPAAPPRIDGRALRRRARLRGWKLPITDGPFAESKEMLGG